MMQYLAWRVLVGLHHSITISFMIVGHTKFAPDWCFGLFKRMFWRTVVGCLDIVSVVARSAEVNHAQLVAKQNGKVLVPTYNWSQALQPHFKQTAFRGIKKYHHFRFDSRKLGKVYVKTYSDEPEKETELLEVGIFSREIPYSRFILREKIFLNFADLSQFVKTLFTNIACACHAHLLVPIQGVWLI